MFLSITIVISLIAAFGSAASINNGSCPQANGRFATTNYCDSYIICHNHVAMSEQCPDGLVFDPSTPVGQDPCVLPFQVSCEGRGALHPAESSKSCPRKNGIYALHHPNDCSYFRICVDGEPFDRNCPKGLAFNPDLLVCDWPGNVAGCDSAAYLGFKCPAPPKNGDGSPYQGSVNFPIKNDCTKFISCINGVGRYLGCDSRTLFDPVTRMCQPEFFVPNCH